MTIIKDSLKALIGSHDISAGLHSTIGARERKKDRYLHLMKGINIVSYSTFGNLHTCERKFALKKLQQASIVNDPNYVPYTNIDFAFGKAIETGVQSIFLQKTKEEVFFAMFLAWDMPLDATHPKDQAKTFVDAIIAIEKFKLIKDQIFPGWEIAYFKGKPAIELAMLIDMETGHFYVGHADIILFHPKERRYRVLEIKTSGSKVIHEAMYKNSDQATGPHILLSLATERERNTALSNSSPFPPPTVEDTRKEEKCREYGSARQAEVPELRAEIEIEHHSRLQSRGWNQ